MQQPATDPHPSDQQLLRLYVQQRDQRAFETLVQRHVRLVYSAAMRRVGQHDLAEDVAQAVFVILSRKAGAVSRQAVISRWLLSTVRFVAANAVKSEARRRGREQVVAMQQLSTGKASADPSEVIIWQEAAALLDDAVLRLSAADRDVLLLRFFQERPVADIALALRVSEGAVKQRLARAVDRLRGRLARRDVVAGMLTAEQFIRLLGAHAVKSAPPALAGSACAAVFGGGAGAMQAISLSKGALRMMHWTKIKIAAAVAGAVIVGGAGGAFELRRALAADAPMQVDASQAAPAASPQVDPAVAAVVEEAAPVVVATVPRAGVADVDPKTTQIRVTYSKLMTDNSWSWFQNAGENTFPQITGKTRYESDHRTCVLPVKLAAGKVYKLYLNRGQYTNFQDVHSTPAVPYVLVFGTARQ
jgi:RNA polymerase sigma factor (sigma-70 family)